MRLIEMEGRRFGRLTVVSRAGTRSASPLWSCRCDCGNPRLVTTASLQRGTKSCGCLRREVVSARRYKHGSPPEFKVWVNMRERCSRPTNKSFVEYGGRGIRVCDRWAEDFRNFIADMGPRPTPQHSIDRIDSDGNYEPDNCRWATKGEQAFNRRSTVVVSHEGEEMALTAYAREIGVCDKALWYRHRLLGEPLEVAVAKISPHSPK